MSPGSNTASFRKGTMVLMLRLHPFPDASLPMGSGLGSYGSIIQLPQADGKAFFSTKADSPGRIHSAHQPPVLHFGSPLIGAGERLDSLAVEHGDLAAHAVDQARVLQRSQRLGDAGAAH